jgi:hypothetical protein
MCHETVAERLTWAGWAWNRSDGQRVAYRQRLCFSCVTETLAPLYVACESGALTCPSCGIDTADDYDAIYCSFYPRGVGKMNFEAPTCGACAAKIRVRAMEGATRLEDRGPQFRGQETAPELDASSPWAAIGLVPHAD